jgi:predicted CoA-binding protein
MRKVVAVVGASTDRSKFGNKAVRAFHAADCDVIPINPHEHQVEDLPAFASVLDVPGTIDMATVYVPSDVVVRLLPEFVKKGIAEIWLNPGADDDEVVAEARRQGLNVIVACSIMGVGQRPGDF